jgi:uncharacterized protein
LPHGVHTIDDARALLESHLSLPMESSFIFAGLITAVSAAFITGLASSLHCLGMCGGAISAMMLTAKPKSSRAHVATFPIALLTSARQVVESPALAMTNLPLILAFNTGRILSYGVAGAVAGSLGSGAGVLLMSDAMPLRLVLFLTANFIMLLTGLYIAGWTTGLAPLERAGQYLWRHLSPVTNKLLPVETLPQAALLGGLWGWIPCGLVYAMLVVALASGSALNGAATMIAFGLGTLPAMTAAGMLSAQMKTKLRDKRLRVGAGLVVIVMALLGLSRAPALAGLTDYASFAALCSSAVTNLVRGAP